MLLLDHTLPQPESNLALDEALLEEAEQAAWPDSPVGADALRFWEPPSPFVVLGRSSSASQEVNLAFCRQHEIPVLRRCSGGATVVAGPGCLMYAVRLGYRDREHLRSLDQAHQFVMHQMQTAIARLGIFVQSQGTCDLTLDNRKVSGNSLRCRRHGFLYHGTLICDLDLGLIDRCLLRPRREPVYRQGRDHRQFITRLPTTTDELKASLCQQWNISEPMNRWPESLTEQLASEKYKTEAWTYKIP